MSTCFKALTADETWGKLPIVARAEDPTTDKNRGLCGSLSYEDSGFVPEGSSAKTTAFHSQIKPRFLCDFKPGERSWCEFPVAVSVPGEYIIGAVWAVLVWLVDHDEPVEIVWETALYGPFGAPGTSPSTGSVATRSIGRNIVTLSSEIGPLRLAQPTSVASLRVTRDGSDRDSAPHVARLIGVEIRTELDLRAN